MTIIYHRQFIKHYKRRIHSNIPLSSKFNERVKLFSQDSKNPVLRDHPLGGDYEGYRSFSISGDFRVIYQKTETAVIFIDVGSHNQLYL